MRRLPVLLLACGAAACGATGDGGVTDADADAAPETDAAPMTCAPEGSNSPRYLPYSVGNQWEYRVTLTNTGEQLAKVQMLTEQITPPGEVEPVIVQITENFEQTTETWARVENQRVVRVRERDTDQQTLFKEDELFDPGKLRLDESPAHIAPDAAWIEHYVRVKLDAMGTVVARDEFEERWSVLDACSPCPAPYDSHRCLHVGVVRRNPRFPDRSKEYWFARGVGKVREQGLLRVEQLVDSSIVGEP